MPKPFSNLLAILFILLSFFGQTMAYSANLPTNTASHSQQSSATDYILTDEQQIIFSPMSKTKVKMNVAIPSAVKSLVFAPQTHVCRPIIYLVK